jgi:hypothetical protein
MTTQAAKKQAETTPPAANDAAQKPAALQVLNVYQRLHRVMEAVDYIQKEKKQGMRYSIVSHDAVTAKVRPHMVAQGVIYFPVSMSHQQNGNRTECTMVVRFQSIDNPADYMDVPTFGFGLDDQDKGPGKAMSYAVKYALLKALGLESGDEPDEDQTTTVESATYRDLATLIADADGMVELGAAQAKLSASKSRLTPIEIQKLATAYKQKLKALQPPANDDTGSDDQR